MEPLTVEEPFGRNITTTKRITANEVDLIQDESKEDVAVRKYLHF